jgi:hypothetical protein
MINRIRLSLPPTSQFRNLSYWTLSSFITAVVNLILVFSAISSFFMLLLGGLRFILAGGEKEATKTATRSMANALIGLVIVFSVYALMNLLSKFFGINLLQYTIISI